MTDNPRDPYDGELASDADLDADGTTGDGADGTAGEGYVDPVEQELEDKLPQGHPSSEPTQLP